MTTSNYQTAWQDIPTAGAGSVSSMADQGQILWTTTVIRRTEHEKQVDSANPGFVQLGLIQNQLIKGGPTPDPGWNAIKNVSRFFVHIDRAPRPTNHQIRQIIENLKVNMPQHNREHLEVAWLSRNRRNHAGQWIALVGDRLVASSTIATDVFAAAQRENSKPLVLKVESEDLPFAGW